MELGGVAVSGKKAHVDLFFMRLSLTSLKACFLGCEGSANHVDEESKMKLNSRNMGSKIDFIINYFNQLHFPHVF